ncbi:hypothetical protein RFI_20469 [Reticulomyxa filosa]|uniref:Uncharacterized protein n=1 Tax=Reticulomyxa filosa TaxID=46433 RepID=X6MTC7_RETFI|nr:hypothetical protein RFI_20469 [Reticulomyxa filosa]|eukprot:ETO16871.1 hypothetical protein RFI_20469 [Reticulomyxa filosa]
MLQIKFGWIDEFDKIVVNYVSSFTFPFFKNINQNIQVIDYSTFGYCQFICSGSQDKTVRVLDVGNNKQIQSFNGHSSYVNCVKFSSYHYYNHRQNVICS